MTDTERHLTILYSCAANCLLYEEDPGPAELNIGSQLEPRMVPRSHAWRDYYAHHLITQVSADIALLRLCSEWAHRQHDRDDLPDDLTASKREEAKQFWRCAIDIADMAVEVVEGAGAATDENARQRLIASSEHLQMSVAFAALPTVVARSAADLVGELDRIDQRDTGD